MFKRIKNLLDISRYTVEELQSSSPTYTTSGLAQVTPNWNPVTIVDLKGTNPFDEYETTEQSSDDTTPRNW